MCKKLDIACVPVGAASSSGPHTRGHSREHPCCGQTVLLPVPLLAPAQPAKYDENSSNNDDNDDTYTDDDANTNQ